MVNQYYISEYGSLTIEKDLKSIFTVVYKDGTFIISDIKPEWEATLPPWKIRKFPISAINAVREALNNGCIPRLNPEALRCCVPKWNKDVKAKRIIGKTEDFEECGMQLVLDGSNARYFVSGFKDYVYFSAFYVDRIIEVKLPYGTFSSLMKLARNYGVLE